MKKVLLYVVLMTMMTGCVKHTVAPVPGQLNTFDAYAYRVLMDAQAAINSFKDSVTSGKVPETPVVRAALNQTINDYNVAEATYTAWHAAGGTGSTVPISQGLTQVQADITNIAAAGGNK